MDLRSHNGKRWGGEARQSPLNAKLGSLSVIALLLATSFPVADAIGLGPAQIHSTLGQPLLLDVPILGFPADQELNPQCAKAYIESLEGARIATGKIRLIGNSEQPAVQVRTPQSVNEPVVNVSVALGCDMPIRRDYQILLDFPPDHPAEQLRPVLPYVAQSEKPVKLVSNRTAASKAKAAADFEVTPSSRRKTARASMPSPSAHSSEAKFDSPASEHKQAQAAEKKFAPRSVLRLSTVTSSDLGMEVPMHLRVSDTLTLPQGGLPPSPKEAEPDVGQNRPASVTSVTSAASGSNDLQAPETKPNNDLQASEAKPNSLASAQASRPVPTVQTEQSQDEHTGYFENLDDRAVALGATAVLCLIAIAGLLWWKPGSTSRKKSSEPEWWEGKEPQQHDSQQNEEGEKEAPSIESMAADAGRENSLFNTQTVESNAPAKEKSVGADTAFNDADLTATTPSQSAAVEEVSDLAELAEAWFALNRPDAVIEILEPMNTEEPPNSAQPWLYLLNAYWLTGDQKNYDDLCQRTRKAFNVSVPDWSVRSQSSGDDFKTLADFPHVKDRIVKLWNSDEIVPYLESLLLDDRGGTRAGFPMIVYQNILRLIRLAKDPAREQLAEDKIPEKLSEIMSQTVGIGPPGGTR